MHENLHSEDDPLYKDYYHDLQVSKAALLSAEEKVQNGRPYYAYNIITGTGRCFFFTLC